MIQPPGSHLDIEKIRMDFPILSREVHPGKPLIYLDSTASAQKPLSVINAMGDFFRKSNANIHRGVHTLAEESTAAYELAREKIARFIGAGKAHEIVYTRNTTESINLVMQTWGRTHLQAGDLVILTEMEHHSNLVPWQMLAAEKQVILEFVPVLENGLLDLDAYASLLTRGPKLVAFTHMSNVLGTINPAREMIAQAHQAGAIVLVDGAQSVPHFSVNVQDLDADFLAFSGHKMCGPTGIGILYGKEQLLDRMPPFLGGGDMIRKVFLRTFTPNGLPHKFEAGTPAIGEAIGLGVAVDYLQQIGMDAIAQHEHAVTNYALNRIEDIAGLKVFGEQRENRGGVISFTFEGVHPHDVAQILDLDGIAVRAGHHCAMPLHEKFGIPATTRASFYLYNTEQEVDALVASLKKVSKIFG